MNKMEKSLTLNQVKSISERINNLSFPKGLKDCKVEFKIYKDNLFEIYRFEILGGNADYLELLRNNNFRIIRKHVEQNGKNQSVRNSGNE